MVTKRAQVKITETIAILFIFFILLVLSAGFFLRFQKVGFERTKAERVDLRAVETAQRVSSLPELQCSTKNIITEACFDILKLEAFYDLVSSNPGLMADYHDLFGYSKIEVKRIYPPSADPADDIWTLYSNPGGGTSLFAPIPILLFDATSETKKYSFGTIEVTYYPSAPSPGTP
tara:strand:- start:17736 stop:18260 length:525 start_codon:yes stop_codon:yes gene_type:complete